jgi:HK97 family phage portal protein
VSFLSWLKDKFSSGAIPLSGDNFGDLAEEYAALVGDIYIREMAFWSAVNLVSNAVSKCEFKTYTNGKETKGREYYLWNIEPNRNQNSSAFLHKLISQLYRKNECLVIELNGQLVVANSFIRTPSALYDDKFTQVTVEDFTFDKTFYQPDVLYFKLSECDMRKVVAGLYESYSKLIEYSMNAYRRSRGTKGIFKYNTLPVAGTPQREAFDKLINEKIGKWLTGDSAALPLGDGQDWKELTQKTYASESTRDIRAMVDDIFEFTARSIGVPPALLKGDVQDTSKAVDQLLTFCIDPLVDMLSEEINRKRNGFEGYSKGTYLQIDTKSIKHVDLLSVSTAIDKLIASGGFCINDIRKVCGEPIIDEPWAWQHFMTKNYSTVADLLANLEGGETN